MTIDPFYYVSSVVAANATPPHFQIMEESGGEQVCIAMVPFNKHINPERGREPAMADARMIVSAMNEVLIAQQNSALMAEALREARAALHFHYVEWDGEPEDAVPLHLARAKCDQALALTAA